MTDIEPVTIRRSKIHGRGVFAKRSIARGERVIEYVGDRLSPSEAAGRPATFQMEVDAELIIDASRFGNRSRYINHSCRPNCKVVVRDRRAFIVALRRIEEGAELCYDYHLGPPNPGETLEYLLERWPCRCGSRGCRGTIASVGEEGV